MQLKIGLTRLSRYWTRTGTSSYDDMSYYVGYQVEEFLFGDVTRRYIATRPALTIQIA